MAGRIRGGQRAGCLHPERHPCPGWPTLPPASQTTAYERIGALIGGSIANGVFDFMANVRASAHMGAAASGEDELIYILNRSAAPRLIVPTWRRAEILRDTGRLQLAGTVTLTGAMFATVVVAGTDLWSRRTIETQ